MKIIITGSLGHISKPLAKELIEKGHGVTVISSNTEKQKDIEALGATAAIGALQDVDFLTVTFAGADAVYCMVPPSYNAPNNIDYYRTIGNNYALAIRQSGVKRVVHLSSYGADLDKGTGLILGSHNVEGILNGLPDTDITHMRPAYFYYNLYAFLDMIKGAGFMAANYGGDDKLVMVSPTDIAAAVAEEIVKPSKGIKVRYVASDELTGNEIANILGAAIGKPDLKWNVISNEEMQGGLESHGVPTTLAVNLVEMFDSIHSGALRADYDLNKPAAMGKVKVKDFAEEFAAVFNQK